METKQNLLSWPGIKAFIHNVISRVCRPVVVAPVFFLLLLLLFCGLDVFSLSREGYYPFLVIISGVLFCYLLVLPCLYLPFFIRKIYKVLILLIGVVYFAINFGLLYLYRITFNYLDEEILATILATNLDEAQEYLSTYVSVELITLVLFAIAVILLAFYALNRISLKMRFVPRFLLFVFLLFSCVISISKYNQIKEFKIFWLLNSERVPDLRDYMQYPAVVVSEECPENIVIILGESFSKSHSSLYGYERPTNPKLGTMFADGLLKIFPNVSSYATRTIPCVKSILAGYTNECADSINWYECLTLIEVVKQAGYKTYWISNLPKRGLYDNEIGRYAELCDAECFLGGYIPGLAKTRLDEELLPFVDAAINNSTERNLYIIQMQGSHHSFKERFPAAFSKFTADDYIVTHARLSKDKRQLLAEYDNSVLYNDSVVYEMMKRFSDKEAVVFYFSDHANDVFESSNDHIGHSILNDELSNFYGKQIPFMLYTTEKFKDKYPQIEEKIKSAVDVPLRTDSVMYTIMDIAGIETINGVSYEEKSIFK